MGTTGRRRYIRVYIYISDTHARVQYGRIDTWVNTRRDRHCWTWRLKRAHRPGRDALEIATYLSDAAPRAKSCSSAAKIDARSPMTRMTGPCPGLSSFVSARDPASRYVHHFDFFDHVVRAGERRLVARARRRDQSPMRLCHSDDDASGAVCRWHDEASPNAIPVHGPILTSRADQFIIRAIREGRLLRSVRASLCQCVIVIAPSHSDTSWRRYRLESKWR